MRRFAAQIATQSGDDAHERRRRDATGEKHGTEHHANDLEHDELRLRDAKTGARRVPLSPEATQMLTVLPRRRANPWVFPGRVHGTRLRTLNASWQIDHKEAGLEDVRRHDLCHSFASRALALLETLPMIGKFLGHTQVQTSARCAPWAELSQGLLPLGYPTASKPIWTRRRTLPPPRIRVRIASVWTKKQGLEAGHDL